MGAIRALTSTHGGDDAVQTAALVEGDEGGAAGSLDVHGQGVAAVLVVRAGADRAVGYVCSFHFDSLCAGAPQEAALVKLMLSPMQAKFNHCHFSLKSQRCAALVRAYKYAKG